MPSRYRIGSVSDLNIKPCHTCIWSNAVDCLCTTLIAKEPGLLALLRITNVPTGLPTIALTASFFDHDGFSHAGSAFGGGFFLPVRLLKGDEKGDKKGELVPVVDRRAGTSPASTNICCPAEE